VSTAEYGCLLVYETPDCSGEFRRFENLDQVEDFLVKRDQSGIWKPCRLFQTADPVPKGLQIFIFKHKFPSFFVKFDGVSQSLFCLLHAAGDSRVAGKD
jgi:hypothetical protein